MVVSKNQNKVVKAENQGISDAPCMSSKIGPSTAYDLCRERFSAFGGLLALAKVLDLLDFEKVYYEQVPKAPRYCHLGHYRMLKGILMLLFIGFQRLGHFQHIRQDSLVTGMLQVSILPAVSTFWRFVQSLGFNYSRNVLHFIGALRGVVWKLCGIAHHRVRIDIDTTVSTVYGDIQGARKGHNSKHRGKKGLRPVMAFLEQTREYVGGFQRRGTTISGREVARLIRDLHVQLPACVSDVLLRGDGEFISWESVQAAMERKYHFIFGVRNYKPPFNPHAWYSFGEYEYNEVMYQPQGWPQASRFVVMRIAKQKMGERQLKLFGEDNFTYRIFVTDISLRPHNVIRTYDKRADIENSVKEAQHEGILAIPSKKFQSNHAFFQIVMLAYNLWRWMKLFAGIRYDPQTQKQEQNHTIVDATVRIARLKMLFVAAKIVTHSDRTKVRYSIHDARSANLIDFLKYLDKRRQQKKENALRQPPTAYRIAS